MAKENELRITPKGLAYIALREAGFDIPICGKELDTFWEKFNSFMNYHGYTQQQSQEHPMLHPSDDDFGAVLNCAVRYALGRKTYMPSLVISFITPMLPMLSKKTVFCFDQDVTDAKYTCGYGDACDETDWIRFLAAVHEERKKRGEEPYKSHWEVNT